MRGPAKLKSTPLRRWSFARRQEGRSGHSARSTSQWSTDGQSQKEIKYVRRMAASRHRKTPWYHLPWARNARTSTSICIARQLAVCAVETLAYYGRPLSVSGRPCYNYFANVFFKFFIWPFYSPAQVNGGSRNFYTWWILSVIREVTTWIFAWSSLNYRVDQKVTKFGIFWDLSANFLLSRPNAAEYCNSEKNLLRTDGCSTRVSRFGELWRHKILKNDMRE